MPKKKKKTDSIWSDSDDNNAEFSSEKPKDAQNKTNDVKEEENHSELDDNSQLQVPKIDILNSFVCSTIGSGTATLLGRYAVSNILKLIPGVGQIIGGLISGSFAGILTNSLGMAYIPIIEAVYKKEVNYDSFSNKDFKDFVNTKFEESLLNYKDRIQDTDTNESI